METDSEYLLTKDGLRLHYRFWQPPEASRVICIVHGHGEHSARYQRMADYLLDQQIAVFAMDLRGHGLSLGKRGHASRYDLLLSDVEELLKTARAEYPDASLYLFGHSMGGNLVANYVATKNTAELSGFILSSPWFRLAFAPPKWKLKAGRWMTRIWPSFTLPSGLDIKMISREEKEVEAYLTDPMVHERISAGLFRMITEKGESIKHSSEEISLPALIYHGTGDSILDWRATRDFAVSNPLFEWHALDQVYHEPHNDLGKEKVHKMIGDWVKKN